MFELEDYSSGFHDGFFSKYVDSSGPTLDLYLSDSVQDMIDIDIRTEIANVVGGTNELGSLVNDLPSAIEALSAINNNSSTSSHSNYYGASTSPPAATNSFTWGTNTGPSWSSSHDFYPDVGACVNPISVMPLISSSLLHQSPKTNLNANALRHSTTSPPASPNANDTKSHLTFSPAQIRISAGAMRNEQAMSHIPKQIVAISSSVTAATTAPATMATNSVLQRKNALGVDSIKKDLGVELRKVSATTDDSLKFSGRSRGATAVSNGILTSNGLLNNSSTTNTIKLGPGIGGLTFANSITYNKLKQQSSIKSPQGSPITANGTIVLKRDRDSSPLHNMTTLNVNGVNNVQHVTKVLSRNVVHTTSGFTPKSIASAKSPLLQQNISGSSSPSSSSSSGNSSPGIVSDRFGAGLTPIATPPVAITAIAVKPLHQKIKAVPVESEYPKPAYSYSCLIALALKNSRSGSLPVSEIYSFMCEHFPYFKGAPIGWKNSVRHNLSLNKCFEKIERPATNGNQRKGCLWAMKTERIAKMDEEVQKWSRKDPLAIRNAMVFPEHLELLERGEMKHGSSGDSDVELDSQSEIEETSDLEEQELDDTVVDNMFVEEDLDEDDMLVGNAAIIGNSIVMVNGADGGNSCNTNSGNGSCVNNTDIGSIVSTAGMANGFTTRLAGTSILSTIVDNDDAVSGHHHQHSRNNDLEVSLEAHIIAKATITKYKQKVDEFYDAIDLEDDKEAVRMAMSQSDIIELSPADMNTPHHSIASSSNSNHSCSSSNGYQSPKRARLNINYSIGPAGELEKHMQIQQQQRHHIQTIKQVRVQQPHTIIQQHQQSSQHTQQHIIVQTIANGNPSTLQAANSNVISTTINSAKFHNITAATIPANHNRRKMQLVNRIA